MTLVKTRITSFDLRTVLPGTPESSSSTMTLSGLSAGDYTLRVRVTDADPRGERWPELRLAQAGRQADGSYLLGTVVLV